MIPSIPGVDELVGRLAEGASDSVFDGILSWMARGLALLIQWIWQTLDSATTPHISEPWFARDLLGPITLLALAVTIAMMLASGIQAALSGRPEQIVDAFKHGAWSVVATALTITVMEALLGLVDAISAGIWASGREDTQRLLEGVIALMQAGALTGMGFLAVLILLFMYLALMGLAVALAMRNALIYVTAALAPIVFASAVLPVFRDSARKLVHLGVSLIVSKLAIVVTLTLAVKMMANATNIEATGDVVQDGVGGLGVLFAGAVCFAVASITPLVLYKLMPTVEGAMVGAGVAGGWGRGAMTGMYGASTAKNLGSSLGQLGSKPLPGGDGGEVAMVADGPGVASGGVGHVASAGGAAGSIAMPVMAASAGIDAFRSGVSSLTGHAESTASETSESVGDAPAASTASSKTPASASEEE